MLARAPQRLRAVEPSRELARGGALALRSDEVPRYAVRLVVIEHGALALIRFAALPSRLRAGDIVVVNDAATLPGSLRGTTARGAPFELRLSGPIDGTRLVGVVFGAGDHRTRTEHRPPPPALAIGDHVMFGPVHATITQRTGRRIEISAQLDRDALWQAIYSGGAPIQYAHRTEPLALWTVQTGYAARPWAAEMPSAGRPLTWDVIIGLRRAGIAIASVTHAAGLSSTGDDELDRALPWPERYEVPDRTISAIAAATARGGRVIAVGTTVVRALEAAAEHGELRAGVGVARLRLDAHYTPRVVDGVISGLHVPGESHHDLMQAFSSKEDLGRGLALAHAHGLSSHELGDSCLILR